MIAAGADGVAVISDIFMADDVEEATRRLRAAVDRRTRPEDRRMTAIALTIAGSDSGGGAGIQADLKTFSALGVYGSSRHHRPDRAEHARASRASSPSRPTSSREQIDSVFADLAVDAVKIGMLGMAEVIDAVADALGAGSPASSSSTRSWSPRAATACCAEDAVRRLRNSSCRSRP